MKAFADSFALIAWLNPRDQAHRAVSEWLEEYRGTLLTTEWVLMEVADALSAPEARTTAVEFLIAVRNDPFFEVVAYESAVFESGFELFANRPDKAWSLTDCISFAVMSERSIVDRELYARMIFAVHSPITKLSPPVDDAIQVWTGEHLAHLVVRLGLGEWVETRIA